MAEPFGWFDDEPLPGWSLACLGPSGEMPEICRQTLDAFRGPPCPAGEMPPAEAAPTPAAERGRHRGPATDAIPVVTA